MSKEANINHAPVALPPGSFEHGDLMKALDKGARAPDDKRDAVLAEELAKANQSPFAQATDAVADPVIPAAPSGPAPDAA